MRKHAEGQTGFDGQLEKVFGLHQANLLEQAEAGYRKILRQHPQRFEVQLLLGILLYQKGGNQEALRLLDKVLATQPDLALALLNKANVLDAMGRPEEALQIYNRALALYPQNPDLRVGRSAIYLKQRRFDQALADVDAALAINPVLVQARVNRGHALQELRRYGEAVESYCRVLEIEPERPQWYSHRANALRMDGRPAAALADIDTALRLDPQSVEALNDRGNLLQELNRIEEAIVSYTRALELRPDYIAALNNRGLAQRDLKRFEAALADFDRVLAISPGDALAQWSKAIVKLLTGDLREGLSLYEWRKKMPVPIEAPALDKPLWTGEQDLSGKTLFLYVEQGLGDTLQFYRYALLAKERGARVILSVHGAIARLLREADRTIEILQRPAVPAGFDFHAPLMSLPLAFGTAMNCIPAAAAYLRCDPRRKQKWAAKIGSQGFKIGICWQGGTAVAGRSFPVAQLGAIAQLPGVRLLSLQKGQGLGQLRSLPAGMLVESYGEELDAGDDAFLDTAAIMASLDLVITADTSLAHLAGTLNRPTWVALKYVPDWRWFLDRKDSPWYSSLRLFRQSAPGEWGPVFSAMRDELLAGPLLMKR